MSGEYIYRRIAEGEHQQQDFKFEISDSRKIAKTLSAFANNEGGRLLIGVKDNGKIAGVRSEEEIHMIEAAAKLYCKPQIQYTSRTYLVEGRTILEIAVDALPNKPCYALDHDNKYIAYLRILDENIPATPVNLRLWLSQQKEKGSFIKYSITEQTLLDFLNQNDSISISQFCKITGIQRHKAIRILAEFIHFELIEQIFTGHQFRYRLYSGEQLS